MPKATVEDIQREINAAIKTVLQKRTEHEEAVAYLTRMQITLELMNRED